jgi:hypothetical protein
VVLVNRTLDEGTLPAVLGDDERGVRLALEHLRDLGHPRIAHLAGSQSVSTGRRRLNGFRTAVRELWARDEQLILCSNAFTEAEGARVCTELLDRAREFTALVAGSDLMALGCHLLPSGDIFSSNPLPRKTVTFTPAVAPHRGSFKEVCIFPAGEENNYGEFKSTSVLLPLDHWDNFRRCASWCAAARAGRPLSWILRGGTRRWRRRARGAGRRPHRVRRTSAASTRTRPSCPRGRSS